MAVALDVRITVQALVKKVALEVVLLDVTVIAMVIVSELVKIVLADAKVVVWEIV